MLASVIKLNRQLFSQQQWSVLPSSSQDDSIAHLITTTNVVPDKINPITLYISNWIIVLSTYSLNYNTPAFIFQFNLTFLY